MSDTPAPAPAAAPAATPEPGAEAPRKKAPKKDTFNQPAKRIEGHSDDPFLSFIFKEAPKYALLCVVMPNGFIQAVEDPNQIKRIGGQIILVTGKGIYTVSQLFLQQPVDVPIVSKVETLSKENAALTQKAVADAAAKKRLADQLEEKKKELEALQAKLAAAAEPAKRR
jgi:hypothetical protein